MNIFTHGVTLFGKNAMLQLSADECIGIAFFIGGLLGGLIIGFLIF